MISAGPRSLNFPFSKLMESCEAINGEPLFSASSLAVSGNEMTKSLPSNYIGASKAFGQVAVLIFICTGSRAI